MPVAGHKSPSPIGCISLMKVCIKNSVHKLIEKRRIDVPFNRTCSPKDILPFGCLPRTWIIAIPPATLHFIEMISRKNYSQLTIAQQIHRLLWKIANISNNQSTIHILSYLSSTNTPTARTVSISERIPALHSSYRTNFQISLEWYNALAVYTA